MTDVMTIGGVIAFVAFILMGIPFLTGALLRLLVQRPSAGRVALLAALLVFAAQLPGDVGAGEGPFAHGLSKHLVGTTSVAAARALELSLWLGVGIGLPFVFAAWGTALTDRLRKRRGSPLQASLTASEPAPGADSSGHGG